MNLSLLFLVLLLPHRFIQLAVVVTVDANEMIEIDTTHVAGVAVEIELVYLFVDLVLSPLQKDRVFVEEVKRTPQAHRKIINDLRVSPTH